MKYSKIILMLFLSYNLYSQDSLRNKHYKVRFSFQTNYTSARFDYQSYYSKIYEGKTGGNEIYSNYQGRVHSEYVVNPEFKVDFELPLWMKFTCGVNYNKLKYSTPISELNKEEYNFIYSPNSTPWNPIVTGRYYTNTLLGYYENQYEIESVGTFIGLGISKQYKHFNFDIDYTFSSNKVTSAIINTKYYDVNNLLQSKEWFRVMDEYRNNSYFRVYMHNFSTSLSYRFYKKVSVKVGFQFSKNDNVVNDYSSEHVSIYKKMYYHSFVFGLVFSVI